MTVTQANMGIHSCSKPQCLEYSSGFFIHSFSKKTLIVSLFALHAFSSDWCLSAWMLQKVRNFYGNSSPQVALTPVTSRGKPKREESSPCEKIHYLMLFCSERRTGAGAEGNFANQYEKSAGY